MRRRRDYLCAMWTKNTRRKKTQRDEDEQWTSTKVQTLIFVISASQLTSENKKQKEYEKLMQRMELRKACGEVCIYKNTGNVLIWDSLIWCSWVLFFRFQTDTFLLIFVFDLLFHFSFKFHTYCHYQYSLVFNECNLDYHHRMNEWRFWMEEVTKKKCMKSNKIRSQREI